MLIYLIELTFLIPEGKGKYKIYFSNQIIFIKISQLSFLSRAKRVTLYLRSSLSMMYPQDPQVYTQGFPELFGGGGGGGDFVGFA